jgi:hypothetical protein
MRPRIHPLWGLALAAIALRLVLFLGRGDYIAFDEGWYLLLGHNLMTGEGYTLSGLRHVALSPLFPILAGALEYVTNDIVWAGRVVAAIASGLLVVPCWFIALRLGGRTAAIIAAAFVAAMPSLAAFVAPFWIGWDLWVGAEPVLHIFLYSAIALCMRAVATRRAVDGLAAGIAFGLAYLARPEAVITAGVAGLVIVAVVMMRRDLRRSLPAVALIAAGFLVPAVPYWLFLHDALGRWTLTGRDVAAVPAIQSAATAPAGGSRVIDDMLWDGDAAEYTRTLYSLDASGTRLANGYWGIPVATPVTPPPLQAAPASPVADTAAARQETPSSSLRLPLLYVRALGRVAPPWVWLLFALGLVTIRRRRAVAHAVLAIPVVATSLLVAAVVAVDPRTQLVVVPMVVIYAALGTRLAGHYVRRMAQPGVLRRGFPTMVIAACVVAVMLGISARRLYLSLSVGSPHHIVGTANAEVGRTLQSLLPEGQPVMSWHPAIALYARRDWRVLPAADFAGIVRYSAAIGSRYIVLSPYYPGPRLLGEESADYLVIDAPPETASAGQWTLQLSRRDGSLVSGTLKR